jgi:hypothetical protein
MPLRIQDGESSRTPNNGDSYKKYQGWRRQKIPERTIMDGTDAGSANTQLAIVPKHQRSWNKVRLPRSNATGLEKDGQRMVVDAQMKCSVVAGERPELIFYLKLNHNNNSCYFCRIPLFHFSNKQMLNDPPRSTVFDASACLLLLSVPKVPIKDR